MPSDNAVTRRGVRPAGADDGLVPPGAEPPFQLPIRPGHRPEVQGAAVAGLVGLVSAVVAAVMSGREGVVGALSATVLVIAFFASGFVPLLIVGALGSRVGAALGLLLINYTLRLAVAVIALLALQRAGVLHAQWLGITVVLCTLAWTTSHLAAVIRASRTL